MHREPHRYLRGELVIVLDCRDLQRSAAFWTGVLGYLTAGSGAGPYLSLIPASGVGLEILLQQVTDTKQQKNRLHIDLRTPDLDAEVSRVLGLGAVLRTGQPVSEDGWRWHVLADPDGNEFCVLQPPDPG
jgi:predicted enzyme related to lactoylglutathione lyase